MAAAFAVCPHCGKNIRLPSDVFESGNCPLCEGPLTMELLRIKNSFINTEEANLEFETAKQYFDNTDFREAAKHFQKSLEYNANHYLAFYYAGLCEVYENEKNEEYDRPLQLMRVLKYSLLKLDSAQVEMQYKMPFVKAAINEINIMLLGEYNKVRERFDDEYGPAPLRRKLMLIGKYVSSFLTIDKELMLVFDPEIAKAVLSLIDLAVSACVKSCATYAVNESTISVPTDEEFEAVKKIYAGLQYFATSLDPNFSIEPHRPDFTPLVLFNKDAYMHIQKYNAAIGKKDRLHFLSVKGQFLTQLTRHCKTAMLYTFNALHKNVYYKKSDPLRSDLLTQGLAFCFELLYPRIHIDGYKRVVFETINRKKQMETAAYLEVFLTELNDTAKKVAIGGLEKFYEDLYKMTQMYYEIVTKTFSKAVNRMKAFKGGKEFKYYVDFLINIVNTAALALLETVEYNTGKNKTRLALLKVGKAAAEEFLLLHDYQIIELEKTPLYAELIQTYNAISREITEMPKHK